MSQRTEHRFDSDQLLQNDSTSISGDRPMITIEKLRCKESQLPDSVQILTNPQFRPNSEKTASLSNQQEIRDSSTRYKTLKVGSRTFNVLEILDAENAPESTADFDVSCSVLNTDLQIASDPENRAGQVCLSAEEISKRRTKSSHYSTKRRRAKRAESLYSVALSTHSVFSAFSSRVYNSTQPPRPRCQLLMNSVIMFGREFCYAVEAGWTIPILLSIGLPANLYSLAWVISPILGFILQPIVGNVSDSCTSRWGRRRPFILASAFLLILGITLLLNGEHIVSALLGPSTTRRSMDTRMTVIAAIAVTIVGAVIFDFSADFIEGPIRAYAMDVCNEEDIKTCLLYQAVLTGVGGAFGYASGGISWTRSTALGILFPSDRQVIYAACAFAFILCCALNLFSIPETPLEKHKQIKPFQTNERCEVESQCTEANASDHRRYLTHHHQVRNLQAYQNDNQNTKAGKQTSDDLENALLFAFVRNHRNKLFEEYETSTPAAVRPQVAHGRKIGKNRGRKHLCARKSSIAIKSRFRPKSKFRKRLSVDKRTDQAPTYGTFNLRDTTRPGYKTLSARELHYQTSVQPTAPPYYDNSEEPAVVHSSHNFQYSSCPVDVLAARTTFPRFVNLRNENVGNDTDDFYSSLSDSEYSKDQMIGSMAMSPYAEVDPGMAVYDRTAALDEINGRETAFTSHRKKLSPASLFDDVEMSDHAEGAWKHNGGMLENIDIGNSGTNEEENSKQSGGLKSLIRAITTMPRELRFLCVCHFLGWVALLCGALFFTDFVGQVVMKGDPRAPRNSRLAESYKRGVEIGNWGLTINATASAIYCVLLTPLIKVFGSRTMYVFGYLAYSVGTCGMAAFPTVHVVLALSSLIGVMSATLYTLPYFLVAQYHENYKNLVGTDEERGKGIDCALVTCVIQLSQIVTGLGIGALVTVMNTVKVTVATASIVSFLGALWAAFFVRY